MTQHNSFETDLDPNPANFVPLSPISLLQRTAHVNPDRTAIIHGDIRRNWAETYTRCRRLASALAKRGIGKGDTVSIMAPNVPEFIEAAFGVPMVGAVLNSLNIRLDPPALAFILNHGECKVLLTDREFSETIAATLDLVEHKPIVIDIDDPLAHGGALIGEMDYEAFIATGNPDYAHTLPDDEWQSITLNYTSGTTGDPKGVVYSHRGAYLNAISNTLAWEMPHYAVYLWTLPMFHCNGWCFPWTVTALGGTHVCLRKVEPKSIFEAISKYRVTHLTGAPIVVSMMINAAPEDRAEIRHRVDMMTGGAAPPASVIAKMEEMGITLSHAYGLTEVYGPAVICEWRPEWDELPLQERAMIKARQGVQYEMQEGLMVADADTLQPVPRDGKTVGEVFMRGNIVMKGYLKNPETTQKSFAGGWFHTGDLAVWHDNGYIEIKDRSKDIIISGGENISSIEVEDVLYSHPSVQTAAVVAKPDEKWGEVPCAFVEILPGHEVSEAEMIAYCRNNLAHFKCPKHVIFTSLPKTATGKIQKFVLREMASEHVA